MMYKRYQGEFLSRNGVTWRCEILQDAPAPFNEIGELTFPADHPLVIDWSNKAKHETVCGSTATLRIESPGDRTYISLYTIKAGAVRLNVYRNNELYWTGALDTEFYEEPYSRASMYDVELTFDSAGTEPCDTCPNIRFRDRDSSLYLLHEQCPNLIDIPIGDVKLDRILKVSQRGDCRRICCLSLRPQFYGRHTHAGKIDSGWHLSHDTPVRGINHRATDLAGKGKVTFYRLFSLDRPRALVLVGGKCHRKRFGQIFRADNRIGSGDRLIIERHLADIDLADVHGLLKRKHHLMDIGADTHRLGAVRVQTCDGGVYLRVRDVVPDARDNRQRDYRQYYQEKSVHSLNMET